MGQYILYKKKAVTRTAAPFNFLQKATTSNQPASNPPKKRSIPVKMATKRVENPIPESSQLSELIETTSASANPQAATTLQVLHNLQHQHLWTSLQIHAPPNETDSSSHDSQPPLISGLPPNRVYTHPDEQLYMLEQGLREDDLRPERLFVIPTAQGQNWSLHRMAAVFDAFPKIDILEDDSERSEEPASVDTEKAKKLEEYYQRREKADATLEWGSKRALLAMVDKGMGGEGTVVYYIVQEGEVKPRQN